MSSPRSTLAAALAPGESVVWSDRPRLLHGGPDVAVAGTLATALLVSLVLTLGAAVAASALGAAALALALASVVARRRLYAVTDRGRLLLVRGSDVLVVSLSGATPRSDGSAIGDVDLGVARVTRKDGGQEERRVVLRRVAYPSAALEAIAAARGRGTPP